MSSEFTSHQGFPTTELPSVPTRPSDPPSMTSSSSHTQSSETQSPYQQPTQPSSPPALPTSQSTLSSPGALQTPGQTRASTSTTFPTTSTTFLTPFETPSVQPYSPLSTYSGSGTSTVEPKLPCPLSLSSMSASNGGQTKGSLPGGVINTLSPTAGTGGTPAQNSPTFSPTTPDIGPSLNIPSGVSSSLPDNGPSIVTSISLKPPVTSMPPALPGQQTPGQSPSLVTLSTPDGSKTTKSISPHSTPTEPVSTGSSVSSSFSTSVDSVISTSSTSSEHEGPSQIIPPSITSSPQSLLSSILSPSNTHNPAKTTTTSSFSIPTDSTTSISKSSKHSGLQTTTSAPMLTSSSQEGSVPSVLSSILSSINTHNPAKISTITSSTSVPTDSTTSTSKSSKHNDPQSTPSTPTSTSSSQEGFTTPASSTILSSSITDEHTKSSFKTSSTSIGSPQTKVPSQPLFSTDSFPSTTSPGKSHTATTLNSTAPGPTGSPYTTSPTSEAASSSTTVPDAKTLNSQSPGGNLAYTSSPTVNAITLATSVSGELHTTPVVQSFNNPAASPSPTAQVATPVVSLMGTSATTTFAAYGSVTPPSPKVGLASTASDRSQSVSFVTSTSTSIYYSTTSSGTSVGVETFTSVSIIIMSTLVPIPTVPTSGNRSNEAAVIGGAVGGVLAFLVLCVAAAFCFIRRRRRSRYHQQLHDRDLTAPLSPEAIEAMRETHPYSPTYGLVGGQVTSEGRDDIRQVSGSFVSSAFAFPRSAGFHSTSALHTRNSSGSVFYEDVSVSNDGYTSSNEGSECTERHFATARSLYLSDDRESSEGVGAGLAIGSESSVDLNSYRTAATRLVPVSRTPVYSDEELESPGPSPSSFPAPPGSNPFLDIARVMDYPKFEAPHVSHSGDVVSAASESAAITPTELREQQESWTAAVAAASPTDAETPRATWSLNPFTEERYVVDIYSDCPGENTKELARPVLAIDPSFIVNPFIRETSQEGFSDDSRSSESHGTISTPFEFRDKGKGKAHLSADFADNTKRNRLSNASSGLEFPENPSQCGIAL